MALSRYTLHSSCARSHKARRAKERMYLNKRLTTGLPAMELLQPLAMTTIVVIRHLLHDNYSGHPRIRVLETEELYILLTEILGLGR